jgi:cytoskeletal protein CcmA (bactofilin family)
MLIRLPEDNIMRRFCVIWLMMVLIFIFVGSVVAIDLLDETKPADRDLISTYGAKERETRETVNDLINAAGHAVGVNFYYLSEFDGNMTLALRSIDTSVSTLIVNVPAIIASDMVVPSTLTIIMLNGFPFTLGSENTLTINGSFVAGLQQIVGDNGTIVFGARSASTVYPEWWGGRGNDAVSDSNALARAQTSIPSYGTIALGPGVWTLDDNLTVAATTTLRPTASATLSIATNKILTFAGIFQGDYTALFTGDGLVRFSMVQDILADWFSGSDIAVKINKAIVAAQENSIIRISKLFWDGQSFATTILVNKAVTVWFPGIEPIGTGSAAMHTGAGNAITVTASHAKLLGGIFLSQADNYNSDIDMLYIAAPRNVEVGDVEFDNGVRDLVSVDSYGAGSYFHNFKGNMRLSACGGAQVRITKGKLSQITSVDYVGNYLLMFYSKFYDRLGACTTEANCSRVIFRVQDGNQTTYSSAPTGLVHGNTYYAFKPASPVNKLIQLADTAAHAVAKIPIALGSSGDGDMWLENIDIPAGNPVGMQFTGRVQFRNHPGLSMKGAKYGLVHESGSVPSFFAPYFNETSIDTEFTKDAVSTGDGTIVVDATWTARMRHGSVVRLRAGTGGTLPAGLAEDTRYYIIVRDTTHVAFASTYAAAVALSPTVVISSTGTDGSTPHVIKDSTVWGGITYHNEHALQLFSAYIDGSNPNGLRADTGVIQYFGHNNVNWDANIGKVTESLHGGRIYGMDNGRLYASVLDSEYQLDSLAAAAPIVFTGLRDSVLDNDYPAIYSTKVGLADPFTIAGKLILEAGNGHNVHILTGEAGTKTEVAEFTWNGTTNLAGDLYVGKNLIVDGNVTVDGNFTGSMTVEDDLLVGRDVVATGSVRTSTLRPETTGITALQIRDATVANGGDNKRLMSFDTLNGNTTIDGNVTIGGNITVDGSIIGDNLRISGDAVTIGNIKTTTIRPETTGVTALQIRDSTVGDGGDNKLLMSMDTTNGNIGLGGESAPVGLLHMSRSSTRGGLYYVNDYKVVLITASTSIASGFAIPAGCKLDHAQVRVTTALAAGELWDIMYSGGATQGIGTSGAVAKNTKINRFFDVYSAIPITSGVTDITIIRTAGGSFTAQGQLEVVVGYWCIDPQTDS